ncbi:MAG: hypothetical protein L3J17_06065 [Candidatus Jettenia sp.]|nr:MAG: hypothetical protein L3J17_06065 [Candidatus Jettenia sp.]
MKKDKFETLIRETFENRLLAKINNLFKIHREKNLISKDSDITRTINKSENNKLTSNNQNEKKHTDHVKNIKENKKLKDIPPKPKTKLPTTEKYNNPNITKKPIINPEKYGNNIGYYPLPDLVSLQDISSNQCCICGTSVNEYILNYCLNNQQEFKGNVYCLKHLKIN